jgi:hypothetical protein
LLTSANAVRARRQQSSRYTGDLLSMCFLLQCAAGIKLATQQDSFCHCEPQWVRYFKLSVLRWDSACTCSWWRGCRLCVHVAVSRVDIHQHDCPAACTAHCVWPGRLCTGANSGEQLLQAHVQMKNPATTHVTHCRTQQLTLTQLQRCASTQANHVATEGSNCQMHMQHSHRCSDLLPSAPSLHTLSCRHLTCPFRALVPARSLRPCHQMRLHPYRCRPLGRCVLCPCLMCRPCRLLLAPSAQT